jgi:hypothetical protein
MFLDLQRSTGENNQSEEQTTDEGEESDKHGESLTDSAVRILAQVTFRRMWLVSG